MITLGKNAALWQNDQPARCTDFDMQNFEFLFIYGSLRRQLGNPLTDALLHHGEAMGEGTLRARLYDLGRYPGAVLSESPFARVSGELYRLFDPKRVFGTLDPYEGYEPNGSKRSAFRRRKVKVSVKPGKEILAWAYLYYGRTEGREVIPSGDYLEHRRNKSRKVRPSWPQD